MSKRIRYAFPPVQRDGTFPDPSSDDAIEAYYYDRSGHPNLEELAAASTQTTGSFKYTGRPIDQPKPGITLPQGNRKVGWTVRDSRNRLLRAFAFNINPQAITRAYGSRTQLSATRGAFYVDTFGQGPTTISLTQMVGQGQRIDGGRARTTARYDIVTGFYQNIYKYVAERAYSDSPLTLRFHDNHWWINSEERVFFPANSLTVQRSVSQHNVWLVTIQMISLDSFKGRDDQASGDQSTAVLYRVKHGDSLHRIIYRAFGHHRPTTSQYNNYKQKVINLNRDGDDITKNRQAPIFNNDKPPLEVGQHRVKRLQLYPGEIILLPR